MKHEYTDTELQAAIDLAVAQYRLNTVCALPEPYREKWAGERSARLDLIKSALASLPEPEPALSQLRPLAEAGEVPEGCVRHYTYKQDGEWTPATKHRAMQITHYIDIPRLPAPAEKPNPYAELKAAHAAGKMIQINCCTVEHPNWIDLPSPAFFGKPHEYRIKPEPETFEAHGKTWTKHTPGDAMPCARKAIIQCLFADGNVWYADAPAQQFRWSKLDSIADIIGWRYADKPTPEPMSTKPISLPLAESMSLRDWLAGQALAGSDISTVMAEALKAGATSDEFSQILSMSVYKIADAMIKAREVKP